MAVTVAAGLRGLGAAEGGNEDGGGGDKCDLEVGLHGFFSGCEQAAPRWCGRPSVRAGPSEVQPLATNWVVIRRPARCSGRHTWELQK